MTEQERLEKQVEELTRENHRLRDEVRIRKTNIEETEQVLDEAMEVIRPICSEFAQNHPLIVAGRDFLAKHGSKS